MPPLLDRPRLSRVICKHWGVGGVFRTIGTVLTFAGMLILFWYSRRVMVIDMTGRPTFTGGLFPWWGVGLLLTIGCFLCQILGNFWGIRKVWRDEGRVALPAATDQLSLLSCDEEKDVT